MSVTQTLISEIGPLPLSNSFVSDGDGEVVFFISGSAWSQTANSSISFTLYLDGQPLGTSMAFTNEAASHKTLVPVFIPAKITAGTHTVELQYESSVTVSDGNDNFTVTIFY